jgi:Fur family transcriptional regulator, ferric uptake regulator
MTELESLCQIRGVRLTRKRRIVCRALVDSGDHPDVLKILARTRQLDPGISSGTVYRTIRALRSAGLLAERRFAGRRARYEDARVDHHHLIDTCTGKVFEFSSSEIEDLRLRIAREFDYCVTKVRVELYGKPKEHFKRDAEPDEPATIGYDHNRV